MAVACSYSFLLISFMNEYTFSVSRQRTNEVVKKKTITDVSLFVSIF